MSLFLCHVLVTVTHDDAITPCLSLCLSPPLPQWAEYILFASLLIAVCVIFSIMAHFYTYIDPAEIEAQFMNNDDDEDDKIQLQTTEVEMVKTGPHKGHNEYNTGKQTRM